MQTRRTAYILPPHLGIGGGHLAVPCCAVLTNPCGLVGTVSDRYIGTLSSSMFAGMMFGAVGWGTCTSVLPPIFHANRSHCRAPGSDLMGRTTAFNATLFLTSLFGVFASLANTFVWLCLALFFLGSAVGVRSAQTLGRIDTQRNRRDLCQPTVLSFLSTCRTANSIW